MLKEILSPKYCLNCLQDNQKYLCNKCILNLKLKISFNCIECDRRIFFPEKRCKIKNHSKLIKFLISFNNYENKPLRDLILLGKNGYFEIFNDFAYLIYEEIKNIVYKIIIYVLYL